MNFLRHSKAQIGLLSCSLLATSVGCGSSIPRLALGPYTGAPEDTHALLMRGVASTGHQVVPAMNGRATFEIPSHSEGYSFLVQLDERGVVHLTPAGPRVRDTVPSLRMPSDVRDEYLALAQSLREMSFRTEAITDPTEVESVSFDARELVNPIERHNGPDQGFLLAGGVTFGVGYLMSVIAGATDQALQLCGTSVAHQGCDSYPYAFIPVGGAIPATTLTLTTPRRAEDYLPPSFFAGVFSVYAQVTGLIIFIVGLAQDTTDIVPGRILDTALGEGARMSASLSAPASDAGLSVSIVY